MIGQNEHGNKEVPGRKRDNSRNRTENRKKVFKYGMLFEFVCIPVGKINYQAFDLNFQHTHP